MSLSSILSSILGRKEQSVLGIDIGSSAIKVVQIKRKRGRAVLETYGELALGPYAGTEVGRATSLDNAKLAEALKDILRESKTTTTACGVALPFSSSLISFINIPQVPEKQMGEVISIEARKYIPVPMTEVLLDWSVIPNEDGLAEDDSQNGVVKKKAMQEVLVVAIHNEYLNTYQSIMTGSGLNPSFYEIELFSSVRSVIDQGVQPVVVLDMGARATKLYIVERGILRSAHIINKGGQDITLAIAQAMSIPVADAENIKRTQGLQGGPEYKALTEIISINLDYIFYEANATILNYQKKYSKNVSHIVMTGGGVLLKGLAELAKVSFQSEMTYADPFGKLETPAFLAEQFAAAGPEFAVAIGVALRRLSEMN
ncbi:MAG: hypothetical protein JWO73_576 [Candidatus Taylorbacteria bacterium]|nr:hypothetical protein [Candidatus Taylorbacteria bacterium]